MKNKLIFLALASSLLLVTRAGIAGTEGETYAGIQYAYGDYNEDGISKTFKPTLLIGRVGQFFTPNFSIEGRLGFGMQDDTQYLPEFGSGYDATLKLDNLFGLYGTGHFNLTESSSIYGVLGVSQVSGTASVPSFPGLESSEDNSSVSYGIGADIGLGSKASLNIEYIRYLDKPDFTLDAISVGAGYRF